MLCIARPAQLPFGASKVKGFSRQIWKQQKTRYGRSTGRRPGTGHGRFDPSQDNAHSSVKCVVYRANGVRKVSRFSQSANCWIFNTWTSRTLGPQGAIEIRAYAFACEMICRLSSTTKRSSLLFSAEYSRIASPQPAVEGACAGRWFAMTVRFDGRRVMNCGRRFAHRRRHPWSTPAPSVASYRCGVWAPPCHNPCIDHG